MNKYLLFTWLLLSSFFLAEAQQTETVVAVDSTQLLSDEEFIEEVPVEIDTIIKVHEVLLSPDSAKAWRKRKEFSYITNLDSVLRATQTTTTTVPKQTGSGSMNKVLGSSVTKYFLWTLAILFLLFIVYQLAKSGRIFSSSNRNAGVAELPDEEELLLHHNFDELIKNALKENDYRLATRYYFLKILQQLRDKNHIAFEPDKTNSRYVREIPLAMQPEFSKLVLQYEFVWYGHYDIQHDHFKSMEGSFQSFSQKI